MTRSISTAPGDSAPATRICSTYAGCSTSRPAGWPRHLRAGRPAWLSPRYLNDVVQIAGARLATPGGIAQVLPDSPELLVRLARQTFADDEPIRALLLARAEEILPQSDLAGGAAPPAGAIGALRKITRKPSTITSAVALRSRQVAWRYELAQLLQQQGRLEEAREQARWCAARTQASQAQEALGRNPLCG